MAKQLNVNLAFTADTVQAKAQIQDLQNQLSKISSNVGSGNQLGLTKELSEAAAKVTELQALLKSATTSTGKLDIGAFSQGLKENGKDLKDYAALLNSLGPEGSRAFSTLARSIMSAEIPMRRANGLLAEMWTTMKNTARWQLTSSVLHGFIGGIHSALGYAKDLNKTLTDIRIVAPEKSMEDMAKFAELANKQAKELSSTTLDYAKGALIYYQQGLDDVTTKERTDVTTKMANVTGDSVDEVSSYMTSIWNNFNKAGDESEEHFADILTKLGAETAASTTEITAALEKYTGVANTIGLSYESATAAATTLIDRLREQPEVAGTALKTIFARLEGLKLEGETSEGGTTTSLNKYSEALHKIGVEIKDANGEMREADNILMDIGEKWNSGELSKDVKIATAETVAGIRQWQQFSALMDNFDYFKQYKDLAATGSEGALDEQQEIYAESWEAASNRVKSSIQTIYMELLNDKFFIKMLNMIAEITDGFGKLIQNIGGLKTILPLVGTLLLKAFGNNLANSMSNFVYNLKVSKKGFEDIIEERKKANALLMDSVVNYGDQGHVSGAMSKAYSQQAQIQDVLISKQEQLNSLGTQMTEQEQQQAQLLLDMVNSRGELAIKAAEEVEQQEKNIIASQNALNAENVANKKQGGKLYSRFDIVGGRNTFLSLEQDINILKELEVESTIASQVWGRFRSDFERAINSNNDEEIKRLQNELKDFLFQLEETGAVAPESAAKIQELFRTMAEGTATIDQIDANIGELSADAIIHYERMLEAGKQTFGQNIEAFKRFQEGLNKLQQEFRETGMSQEEFIRRSQELLNATNAATGALQRMAGQAVRFSQGLVKLGNSAMQMGMALQAVKGLENIWNDEDLSTGEKYLQLMISMGMILPGLHSAFQLLESSFTAIGKAFQTGGAISKLAGLIGPGGIIFLIIAALTTLGVVLYKVFEKKRENEPVKRLEELKKESENAEKQLNAVNSKIGEIDSSLDGLKGKQNSLKELEKGTNEWRQTLSEANQEVLDTVENVNDLTDSLSEADKNKLTDLYGDYQLEEGKDYFRNADGGLEFTEVGEAKIQSIKTMTVSNAQIEVNSAKIAENRQQQQVDEKKLGQELAKVSGTGKQKIYDDDEISKMSGVQRHRLGLYKTKDNQDWQGVTEYQTEGSLTEEQGIQAIQDISTFMQNHPYFTTDQIQDENSELFRQLIDQGIIDEDTKNALLESKELQKSISDHVNNINNLKEQEVNNATNDLLSANDNELYKKLYGYVDPVTGKKVEADIGKENEEFASGIAQTMGEDALKLRDKYIEHPYKNQIYDDFEGSTYHEQKESAKEAFLSEGGYEKTEKGYKNAEGQEIKTEDLESEVANWASYKKAIDDVNASYENYKKEIEDSKKDWQSLDKVKNIFKNQRKEINKAAKQIDDFQKGLNNNTKATKKALETMDSFAETIKGPLSEALDVDPSNTVIDGKFVSENLDKIEAAMDGNIDALEELKDAYGQAQVDQILELHLDDASVEAIKDQVNDKIAFIQNNMDELSFGMTVDQSVIDSANQVIAACARTKEEAEAILDGFGIDAEVTDAKIPAEEFEGYFDNVKANVDNSKTTPIYNLDVDATASGIKMHKEEIGSLPVPTITYENVGSTAKKDKAPGGTIKTWKIKTGKGAKPVTKKDVVLPRSTGSGSPKSSGGPRGGGGRRGSGQRGSSRRAARERTVERARRQNEKSKVLERYKEITDKLERNTRVSDRLSKIQDKLYGKARLDQMDKVNKKHLEEIKLLEKKQKEARQYYLNDRRDAEKALKQAMKVSKQVQKQEHERLTVAQKNALDDIKGLKFNSSGEITNYTDILKALQDQLNAYERVYNSAKEFGNAESQNQYKEKYIDPLKEQIDSLKEAIDQYDETRELAEEVRDQIEEAYAAWQQSNYEKLQYALELKVTINDNDLKRIDYYLSKTSGNVYKAAEALGQYFGTSSKGIANFQKSSNKLQERLKELEKSREKVQEKIKARTDKEKDKRKEYNDLKKKRKVKNKKYGTKRTYTINGEKVTLNKKEGAKYWSKSIERKLKNKRDAAKKAYEKKKNDKNVSEKEKERLKNKYLKAEAKLRDIRVARRKYQAKLDELIEEGAKGLKGIKQKRNSYKRDTVTYKTKSGKKRTVSIEKLTKEYNEAYKKQKEKIKELKKKRDKYKEGSKGYKKYDKQYDEAKNKLENITKRYENRLFKNNKYNQKKYDYAKKKYNNYAKKAEEQKKKRDKLKKDSPEWTKANEQYKNYLDLRKKWKKLFKKQQTNKAQYEKWQIAYENYKKLNDELKKRNQIIKNQEKAIAEANKNLAQFTMLTASGGKIGAVTKAIYNQVQAFEDLSTSYKLAQITQADYIDSMQQIHDEIYSLLSELQDLKNELKGYYGETLTNALDELNKYNDKLTHNESLISHFQNIANLSRWDDSNNQWTDKFLLAQQESIGTKLENDRKLLKNLQDERDEALLKRNKFILNEVAGKNLSDQKLLNASLADINGVLDSDALSDERRKWIDKKIKEAKAERNQAKKELDNLLKNENASQKKINEAKEKYLKANATVEQYSNVSEEEFKDLINTTYEYYDEIYQSLSTNFDQIQEEFYSTAEEALENANNLLEEFCDRAASNMERLLTGIAGGFEELSKRISLTSQLQEDYLTKTNQDYELNKMQRTLQKDIDKANSKTAKNKLSNFAKELKSLQESNKLSNLELEIAQKRYEILKAQIELEESRGAKQTIRLSRDNEGNYGYVYVANEEETEDAEQNVKNLENDLYNLLRENINNREQSYIQLAQDRENALTEIWGKFYNQEITASERDELLANANKQYSQLMESQSHLINIASTSVEGISDLAKQDSWVDSEYSGFVTRIQNNLAAYDAYSENMRNAYKQFEATVSQLHITGDTVNEELTKISETNADVLNDFNTSLNKIDKVLDEVQDKILKFTQNTLPIIESQISVVENKLQSFADTIERFVTGKLNTNDVAYTNFSTLITRLADNAGVATEETMLWNNGVAFNPEVGGKAFYNSNKWGSDVAKANDKTAGKMLDIISSGEGNSGTRVFGVSEEGYLFYLLTSKTMQDSDNGAALKKKIEEWKDKHNIKQKVDDILTYQQFASGGYTGDWNTGGQEGKIGILHEKELVLNQTDTSNILAAVEGMRELASSGFLNSLSALSLPDKLLANSAQQLDQNVSIEASFPNVTDRNEIEQAFNNLVNRASQYAYTNRK